MPSKPPLFFKLVSHPIRWQILTALAESDRRGQELAGLTGQPQNLVSYHLKRLLQAGLIRERRSSVDARQVYFSLDVDALRQQHAGSAAALHPALSAETDGTPGAISTPLRVLFLCTHNSARSQMAEALLRHLSEGEMEAFSAGTQPSRVHPLAVQAMQELGIDIRSSRSKHVDELRGEHFDYVITVCDSAREACPTFPGHPRQLHWSLADPAAVEGTEEERLAAFQHTASQLAGRIRYFLLALRSKEGNEQG